MPQAMIIEQNQQITGELTKRLVALGYKSIDHVWTEDDAVALAEIRPPDLILLGDDLEAGDGMIAARRICDRHNVPVLLVTADAKRIKERLADGAILDGPFSFSKLPETIQAACKARSVGRLG